MKKIISRNKGNDCLSITVNCTNKSVTSKIVENIHKIVSKENHLLDRDGKERISFEIVMG